MAVLLLCTIVTSVPKNLRLPHQNSYAICKLHHPPEVSYRMGKYSTALIITFAIKGWKQSLVFITTNQNTRIYVLSPHPSQHQPAKQRYSSRRL